MKRGLVCIQLIEKKFQKLLKPKKKRIVNAL
jgi:hypothetical protein